MGDKVVLTVEEAAVQLGCGRTRVFELMREGVLHRARRLGKKTMVFAASVEAALKLPAPRPTPAAPRRTPPPRPVVQESPADGAAIAAEIRSLRRRARAGAGRQGGTA